MFPDTLLQPRRMPSLYAVGTDSTIIKHVTGAQYAVYAFALVNLSTPLHQSPVSQFPIDAIILATNPIPSQTLQQNALMKLWNVWQSQYSDIAPTHGQPALYYRCFQPAGKSRQKFEWLLNVDRFLLTIDFKRHQAVDQSYQLKTTITGSPLSRHVWERLSWPRIMKGRVMVHCSRMRKFQGVSVSTGGWVVFRLCTLAGQTVWTRQNWRSLRQTNANCIHASIFQGQLLKRCNQRVESAVVSLIVNT